MKPKLRAIVALAALAVAALASAPAAAHCDGLDGPVVTAARQALGSGNPDSILIWVQPRDEAEIRAAFRQALAVRRLGGEAQALADRFFFETLVRLHRAGEGAPFNGLQPAGRDLGPAIPLADKAVATGSDAEIAAFLSDEVARGVHARFADLQRKRRFDPANLAAGRDYVASYVAFVHYVEGLHAATQAPAEGHYPEPGAVPLAEPHHDGTR
jgi:hypothetical protein